MVAWTETLSFWLFEFGHSEKIAFANWTVLIIKVKIDSNQMALTTTTRRIMYKTSQRRKKMLRIYKRLQVGFRPPPLGFFFSTARIDSSNTFARFVFLFAEHSTNVKALILLLSFFPSTVVTNFSEPWIRKSAFVPRKSDGKFELFWPQQLFIRRLQVKFKIALRAKTILRPKEAKKNYGKLLKITHSLFVWSLNSCKNLWTPCSRNLFSTCRYILQTLTDKNDRHMRREMSNFRIPFRHYVLVARLAGYWVT